MDTLYSAIKEFVGFGFKIKSALESAKHNMEECRKIDALLLSLRAISKHLQRSPKIMEDDLMRGTAEGLRKALQRASEFVDKCKRKGVPSRAFNAKDIAEKLHGVCFHVLLNMCAVLLAIGVFNSSQQAELKENMAQLRTDVTNTNSMLAKILQIVAAARPDADLPQEVEKLVEDDQISSQIRNKGKAKETVAATSQDKNKGESKKIDVTRTEVKNQKKNKKLRPSTVVPHASLPDVKRQAGELKSFIVGKLNMDSGFMVHVENLKAEVYRAMLTAITCHPATCQIISRPIEDTTLETSIDAHPTKPCYSKISSYLHYNMHHGIVTGHEEGSFSIWDYQKKETVMELQLNDKGACQRPAIFQYFKEKPVQHSIFSVKFTAEGKCLVVGDGHGHIYVYDYTDTKPHKVKAHGKSVNSLAAHPTEPYLLSLSAFGKEKAHGISVDSLAAHPTEPYLLSSSVFGRNIKVWDWSKNWKKFQNFYVKPENTYYDGVHSVKFNPRDTNTFACVTSYDGVKIWDLKTREVVHTLSMSGRKTTWVACHPKLPILVTTLDDGTVCLWHASTYRLEKMVHITNSKCRDLVFVQDINGRPRISRKLLRDLESTD
ncbi:Coatomer subunit beta'-1 [Triticum urartu]|uniref:Coatomer subunit beta'-1 n=1 Tax=Triticum urartu TaxID=4572 RepID=M7YGY9_TRIUA|nr:Coatomer subunit beta'-1 [Triticum urartu]